MFNFKYSGEHLTDIHWSKLVAKAWLDEMERPNDRNNFRHRLERNPRRAVDYAIENFPEFADLATCAKRIFQVDDPPSPLDDYTAELINDIRDGKVEALYFPVGTCC
ncbi:MAG: hypothetical protein Fur0044_26220 [Anaerolineae bacterium]|nr:hypothetical protein [Anaerolineales bacterium]MCK6628063.1 hypothetical protein [Anaerolineae bacterium]MCQ3975610.1 hypothetical protein [Anaerolineae bacterium]